MARRASLHCSPVRPSPIDNHEFQSYEMIAPQNSPPTSSSITSPPIPGAADAMAETVAVPTHFAKVILSSRPPRASVGALVKGSGADKEWSVGAFVLPNAVIPDDAPLTSFVVPGTSCPSLPQCSIHLHSRLQMTIPDFVSQSTQSRPSKCPPA